MRSYTVGFEPELEMFDTLQNTHLPNFFFW